MWNELTGVAGHSGVMGPTLGLIWLAGLALATIAWLTLPGRRRH